MASSRKTSRLLLPIVLAIWAILGWKFYAMMNTEEPAAANLFVDSAISDQSNVPDTYHLLLDYDDPFGMQPKKVVAKTNNAHVTIPVKKDPLPPPVVKSWPDVKYFGLVKSPHDGKTVGFLTINGGSHFIRGGEKMEDLFVKNIWKDSVQVVWENQARTIMK